MHRRVRRRGGRRPGGEKLDQLRGTLAASEGIVEVLHEDREVFHLKIEEADISAFEGKVAEAVERTGIGHNDHSPQ